MGAGASTDNDTAAASIIDGEDSILARAGGVLLPRDELYEALKAKLAAADRPVAVVAPSGSGKSTFMARAVQRLRGEYDVVRAVFVGGADGSTQLVRVLSELCASLDDEDDAPMPDDVLGLSGLLERRLSDLSDTKRVLLVVDAVNELEGAAALSLGWLPRRAGVVVTTIRGGVNKNDPNVKTVLAALKRRGVGAPLVVPALSTPEQAALLAQLAGRAPAASELAALGAKKDRASPLYIRLLAPRLAAAGGVAGGVDVAAPAHKGKLRAAAAAVVATRGRGRGTTGRGGCGKAATRNTKATTSTGKDAVAACPGTIREVFDELLAALPQAPAKMILCAVHVSGGGVYASQLRDLADGATLEGLLGPLVRAAPMPGSRHACVSFVHQQARDAVARRWLKTPNDVAGAHAMLAGFFTKLYDRGATDDAALERQILTRFPSHLIGAGDAKRICDPAFGERKCAAGGAGDLCQDFADAGFDDFAETARANAHILSKDRYVPGLYAQQLANARDESTACVQGLRAPFRWRNKARYRVFNRRDVCSMAYSRAGPEAPRLPRYFTKPGVPVLGRVGVEDEQEPRAGRLRQAGPHHRRGGATRDGATDGPRRRYCGGGLLADGGTRVDLAGARGARGGCGVRPFRVGRVRGHEARCGHGAGRRLRRALGAGRRVVRRGVPRPLRGL